MTFLAFFSSDAVAGNVHELRAKLPQEDATLFQQTDQNSYLVNSENSARDSEWVVAFVGAPRYEGTALNAEALLQLVRKHGKAVVERLHGPFSIVIHNTKSSATVAAIDRMGIERMAYCVAPGGLFIATSATLLRRISGIPAPIRNQGIYDFLFFHMVPSPNTIFENIAKLPPAHILEFSGRRISTRRYWQPVFEQTERYRFDDLRLELDELLESATRACLPDDKTGAFLSGGIDSSTVAGHLARVLDSPVDTFSIGFGVEEFDELKFARISAAHFSCRGNEYNVTSDDIGIMFNRIAGAYDEPFGNSSVVPTYFCAKLAADSGVTHLLGGDGGDELFAGNERYAKHKLFELYSKLPSWSRKHLIEAITNRVPPDASIYPLRKLKRYVDQALIPLPDRMGANLAFSIGLKNMLSPDFVESIDTDAPAKHMRLVYEESGAETVLDKLLAYDWKFTLADNDIRKVNTMCELAGVKVSYPLLDDRIVEFSTRIPAAEKLKGFELRSFFKRAMADFLPKDVLTKSKHGFGLPFGVWLKTDRRLGDLVYSNLSAMNSRNIFKSGFIDNLIDQHRVGAASYYGAFIWDLAMIEEWLSIHGLESSPT